MDARDFDQVVLARRSVRAFRAEEAAEGLIADALTLAQRAPSNCNVQPWTPHIVSGPALARLRAALWQAASEGRSPAPDYEANWTFTGVYRERQLDAARALYAAIGVGRGDAQGRREAYLRNFALFDAPHAAFLFLPASFGLREAADAGMWAQTFMLALVARGLASCAQGALSLYPDIVRAQLGIGDDARLLCGIAFGYEDSAAPANAARTSRASLTEAARFHR